ncbi:hypothetical protein HA402_008784 [Bradysia odoriphaga]|nr:hypothetical protein HA402_008784 [Bradysia odoriphaga]
MTKALNYSVVSNSTHIQNPDMEKDVTLALNIMKISGSNVAYQYYVLYVFLNTNWPVTPLVPFDEVAENTESAPGIKEWVTRRPVTFY